MKGENKAKFKLSFRYRYLPLPYFFSSQYAAVGAWIDSSMWESTEDEKPLILENIGCSAAFLTLN
jgi:hypothetical protein